MADPIPTPAPDEWHEEAKESLVNLYLAEKAMMLDKWGAQQRRAFATANFAVTGNPGDAVVNADEEMGVSVGNKHYHYYGVTQTASGGSMSEPNQSPPPAAPGGAPPDSSLAPAAAGIPTPALVIGGIMLGALCTAGGM